MDDPSYSVDALDRLVHDPARLMICTALLNCASADFVFLRQITGLTAGNLSSHLTRLQQADMISLDRRVVDRTTRTQVALTQTGRQRVAEHWHRLQHLRNSLNPHSAP